MMFQPAPSSTPMSTGVSTETLSLSEGAASSTTASPAIEAPRCQAGVSRRASERPSATTARKM